MKFQFLLVLAALPLLADEKPKLPEGAGKAVTEKLCGACHGTGIFVNRRESREGWNGIIEDMINRGMKGEDEDFGQVSDYLAQYLSKSAPGGKVNMNQGSAKAIVSALSIPESEATAIVEYRVANGKFKSFEDLAKVPGLTLATLEKQKDKLDF